MRVLEAVTWLTVCVTVGLFGYLVYEAHRVEAPIRMELTK